LVASGWRYEYKIPQGSKAVLRLRKSATIDIE
jgi:hypothetical protein